MEIDKNEASSWLVGAKWGVDVLNDDFFRRGYWEMGWSDDEQPGFANQRDSMKPGDRIAIKRMNGQGATTITILALGVVKEVFQGRVYVDWKVTDMEREVESRGCFKTIHGPYQFDDEWTRKVFCL